MERPANLNLQPTAAGEIMGAAAETRPLAAMPNVPLSDDTQRRVEALFAEDERAAATQHLVEQCGDNLPFNEGQGPVELERIRFAALKLSAGSLTELREAVALANIDSRDVLVAAGFGNDVAAHRSWMPQRRGV